MGKGLPEVLKMQKIVYLFSMATFLAQYWMFEFIGRLHPMLVHFPIALLIVAACMEIVRMRKGNPALSEGITWLVYLGAASALISAGMGLLLEGSDAYSAAQIQTHKWTGLLTAGLALLAAVLLRNKPTNSLMPYRIVLFGSVICLTIAGHLGASLTHGDDYLTSVLPGNNNLPTDEESSALLAEFTSNSDGQALTLEQKDRLNLEVRAIFAHSCYKCHSSEKQKGELVLDDRKGVMKGGESGPVVIPGDAAGSELMRRLLLPRDEEESMPQKAKALTADQIELVRLWIDEGAHWADGAQQTFREAPLELTKPKVPPASKDLSHPIDRLVNVYFEKQGIEWQQAVDDRTFIRRVYLDAIGLLPTPEEITAFEGDNSPKKREALVRETLAQHDNYAQHWLSFWNDLLRNDYSGTGFITGGRKQVTGWLYEALESNKPYHEMVNELISPHSKESEGFITGIRWRGTVNASQTTEMQAAQNISQSLLGLNLKCASCHNSFVSNITLDEAYGFASIFADTAVAIARCDKPTGRIAKMAFLYPELGTIDSTLDRPGRLQQLADFITQPENGRLYRTIANRFWDRLMGRGIVAPVDEMDRLPWDQDLLDWLAADLIEHEYDLKHLLEQIMTSRTYQLPSVRFTEVNEVLAANYTFRGPLRRRLSAEQFADVLGQIVAPVYHGVAFDPSHATLEAEWIWTQEKSVDRNVLPPPEKRWFRHAFDLQKGKTIVAASMLTSVDHSYELFLNESAAAQGADWRTVQKTDITPFLKPGKNQLAIAAENDGELPNPAGILLHAEITFTDGTVQEVCSHDKWKASRTEPKSGWKQADFDDSEWEGVRRYGRYRNSYWGQLLTFRHQDSSLNVPFVRASLVKNDPFMKALGRPIREVVITKRSDQATLLQALELTNGVFFNETISRGAKKWIAQYGDRPDQLVEAVYQQAFGRKPEPKEQRTAIELLGSPVSESAMQDLLWAVVLLPEFQLIY